MSVLEDVVAAELEGWEDTRKVGGRTLADAFQLASAAWQRGDHSRDLGLHLMFLAWYGLAEPSHLTGFTRPDTEEDLRSTFTQVHDELASSIGDDPEFFYVVGLMAHLFPWELGDYEAWLKRSQDYRRRYRRIVPTGPDVSWFAERGAYGAYFRSQARVSAAY